MSPDPPLSALTELLVRNPQIRFAYYDFPSHPRRVHVYCSASATPTSIVSPKSLLPFSLQYHPCGPLHPLIVHRGVPSEGNINQLCQDEPILLGTQVQPSHAHWFGTAGSPAKWSDASGTPHWGFLTNSHVLTARPHDVGREQHQPTTDRPSIGHLSRHVSAKPLTVNHVDAGVADTLTHGYHTTSAHILHLPPLHFSVRDAYPYLRVLKSGRTTARTAATCLAVGASSSVQYPDFTAIFEDQDIYSAPGSPFSAPGDSGSLIVTEEGLHPTSLLFAGNALFTVANPMRYVVDALGLLYPFP